MKKDIKKSEQNKYLNILLTDIQLHTIKPRKPTPWYRAILKSFKNKKPGRFYAENFSVQNDETLQMTLINLAKHDPLFQKQMEIAEKSGKKIRIIVPPNLPIYSGKDLIEKLKTEREKRKKRGPLTRVWRSDNIKQD